MSAIWPVQQALAARLKADAALMARVTGVFDGQAPQAVALPFVVIGEPAEVPGDAFGDAFDTSFLLHVWSATTGSSREAHEIAALIDAALAAPLAVPGYGDVSAREESRNLLTEEDGTRHLALRLRFLSYA